MTRMIYGAVFALLMARFARHGTPKEIHIGMDWANADSVSLKRPVSMAELTIHVAGM